MAKALNLEEKNAEKMHASLQLLGIHDIDIEGLKVVLRNKPDPYKMDRWIMKDDNKIKLQIKFDKSFAIDHFVATFVPKLPVSHTIIKGVDTKALEEKMKGADWYYASESPEQLDREYKKIEKIESEIDQLIKSSEGLRIATIIWNNHVPFYTATKPEAIRNYENNGDLYITQKFSGDVPISIAFEDLEKSLQSKLQQEVNVQYEELELTQFPGVNGPNIMASTRDYEIIADDPHSIRQLIQSELSQGKEWVVFDQGKPTIHSDDLNFFETDFEVAEFCHENETDRDFFQSMAIHDFEIALQKWENALSNPKGLLIALEEKMKTADWNYKDADHYDRHYEGEKEMGQIKYLLSLVKNKMGIGEAQAIWEKYAPEHSILKPDFLTINNKVMTEKELAQPKIQLARIGISEAYSENLITRMKNGEKEIHDPYSVTYKNGDQANAVFHWKKSDESNLYFLNKWDLNVKKADHENEVQKTFYINDPKRSSHVLKNPEKFVTTFTFKGSVNYLCERPVENLYRNQNDQHLLQWDLAKVLPNGKLSERHFHPNYKFDLKKVGDEYRSSIKDLSNSDHAERFYQSLQRGNLQSATFVEKNGKETTLLVTPNITVGHFNIFSEYSKNAKPLTPEQQLERGFISAEFATKVRERIMDIESSKQTYKKERVSENSPGEKKETVREQRQGVSSEKKNNKQKEKLDVGSNKPKKKIRNKLS